MPPSSDDLPGRVLAGLSDVPRILGPKHSTVQHPADRAHADIAARSGPGKNAAARRAARDQVSNHQTSGTRRLCCEA